MQIRLMNFFKIGLICSALFAFQQVSAQADTTDLLSLLGPEEETTNYVFATFKSTRVINMHSNENPAAGVLDFRISHRFGAVNTGADNLWGLDVASMRLGFEYGVTDGRIRPKQCKQGNRWLFEVQDTSTKHRQTQHAHQSIGFHFHGGKSHSVGESGS
jgi:hypothetical protein